MDKRTRNIRVCRKTAKNRGSTIGAKSPVEAGYGREHSQFTTLSDDILEFSSIQDIEGYEVNW